MATTSHQLASKWLTLRLTIRRLVPDELDQLQCFPRGWTNTGMSDGHRAFCMGNALVTGIPHEIGKALVKSLER
ncbi:DNA cytosine methyltransferase [Paratractidigestivibacter faecalis]|uniref:DNA cytosine methyltransferase n=1 Tax=Paratractidigestivibacter faecalis TaxID=2292441 RepID=UPI003AB876F6